MALAFHIYAAEGDIGSDRLAANRKEAIMKSHAMVLGHPIHPMLITFPVGLLATGVLFEIVGLLGGGTTWMLVAFYLVAAGVIGGLLAGVFGFVDYLNVPANTRAKSIATMHGTGNVAMLVLFAIAWFLWMPTPRHIGIAPAILTFVAVTIIAVTGWLGGELVDRLGVGVDPGANLDAPSSLSGLPASADLQGYEDTRRRA